jgi:serine/threonine-protein kinase
MGKDPAERPATPSALADLLAAAFPGAAERVETRPPTAPLPMAPVDGGGRPLGSSYLLDSQIGRGATGQVWRARRRDNGAPVAVKMLRSDLADDPETVTRFLRERAALTRLRHPNLVRVHDLVAEGGTLAIVMDLVDGADLRRTIAGGGIARADALRLLAQVASALCAVHGAGIVHRDLKPENVLVEWSGGETVARLTDFGIARAAGDPLLTRSSRILGTPAYLAPELAAGRPAAAASDVYSFGVMAYELLTGRRPFEGDNAVALIRAHIEQSPARPADLPGDVWRVVERCLAKAPEVRPSAAELARDLPGLAVSGSPRAGSDGTTRSKRAEPGGPAVRPSHADPAAGHSDRSGADRRDHQSDQWERGGRQRSLGLERLDGFPASGDRPALDGPPASPPRSAGEVAAAGPPLAATGRASGSDPLVTAAATAPPPERPSAPPQRRRPWRFVVAAVLVAVVGAATGVGLALHDSRHPPRSAGPAPQPRLVPVPFVAVSPEPGLLRLHFTGGRELPGFDHYMIRVDGRYVPTGKETYEIRREDTRTRHCFQVGALVITTADIPRREAGEQCLAATGH